LPRLTICARFAIASRIERMVDRRNLRGPGARRFDRLMHLRAAKKLKEDETLLYEHALRCFCNLCGGLLNWSCPKDISYTETECCGLLYRLQPWTVKVWIEDVSSRPILPKMSGSNYADPDFAFSSAQIVGSVSEPRTIVIPAKNYAPPTKPPQVPRPPGLKPPTKKKVRKCGICRKPGHTRRKCPERET